MSDYYYLYCKNHNKYSGDTKNGRRLELAWKNRIVILPLISRISILLEDNSDYSDRLHIEETFIRRH